MVYLTKGGFWLSASYLVGSVSSFILAFVLANALSPDTYGTYKYVLSIAQIVGILTLPGLDTSLVRSVARGKEQATYQVMYTRMRWGILAALASLGLGGYYWLNGNAILAGAFTVMALFIPFMDALGSWSDLLAGRKAFRLSANLSILITIAGTLITAATGFFFPAVIPLSLAYFGGWSLVRGISLVYTFRRYPPNTSLDSEVIPYGKHLTVMKGISTVAGAIGSIVLFHVSGVALAVYVVAIAPVEQARGLLGILQTLALPKFSQDEWRVWTLRGFFKKTRLLFIILLSGIIAYVFIAPYFYALLFPKYLAAIPYSQVWAFSLFFTLASTLIGTILKAKQEIRKLYTFNVISMTMTFVLTAVGTYFYGVWGLLGAQFATKGIQSGVLLYLLHATSRSDVTHKIQNPD